MNTTMNKVRNFLIVGMLIVIVLQVCAVFSALVKYTPSNVIFYCIMVYFTMRNLFSEKPHHICAFLWSLLTAYLLGLFWGALTVILYWVLYFLKVRAAHTSSQPQRNATQRTRATVVQTTGTIKRFGRIPFVRLPIPWLKYTLDLDQGVLTRDNFFPERHDKDDSRHDFLGKDDDLLLKQVFDWSFSTKLWRRVAGTSCFEFQSKKIGRTGDKKKHWHCLPNGMVESLRHKLIEVN